MASSLIWNFKWTSFLPCYFLLHQNFCDHVCARNLREVLFTCLWPNHWAGNIVCLLTDLSILAKVNTHNYILIAFGLYMCNILWYSEGCPLPFSKIIKIDFHALGSWPLNQPIANWLKNCITEFFRNKWLHLHGYYILIFWAPILGQKLLHSAQQAKDDEDICSD